MEQLPLQLQTVYADLLQNLLSPPATPSIAGSIIRVEKSQGAYWVARQRAGRKVTETSIGPDTDDIRNQVQVAKQEQERVKEFHRQTASYVAMLKSAGVTAPDLLSGQLLAAVAKTGFFQCGGLLGGTHAFRHYALMLGAKAPQTNFLQTGDVDLMVSNTMRLTSTDASLSKQIENLGIEMETIFPMNADDPPKWRVKDRLELEILSPVGRGGAGPVLHRGVGEKVNALKYLQFSLKNPTPAVSLYREGALIMVPAPERYALHKLLVAGLRSGSFAIKTQKDLAQAGWLIDVLSEVRPYELWEAWGDLRNQGKQWRRLSDKVLANQDGIRAKLDQIEAEFGSVDPA